MAQAGHAAAFSGRAPARAFSSARIGAAAVRAATVLVVLLALCGLWELFGWIWVREAWTWPFPVNDTTLPHISTIFKALGQPATSSGPLLVTVLLHAAW